MLQWRRRSKSLTMTMSGRPVSRDGFFSEAGGGAWRHLHQTFRPVNLDVEIRQYQSEAGSGDLRAPIHSLEKPDLATKALAQIDRLLETVQGQCWVRFTKTLSTTL